jgi:hypothetical protein
VVALSAHLPGWAVLKIDDLMGVVFAGLSALVIEDVRDEYDFISGDGPYSRRAGAVPGQILHPAHRHHTSHLP